MLRLLRLRLLRLLLRWPRGRGGRRAAEEREEGEGGRVQVLPDEAGVRLLHRPAPAEEVGCLEEGGYRGGCGKVRGVHEALIEREGGAGRQTNGRDKACARTHALGAQRPPDEARRVLVQGRVEVHQEQPPLTGRHARRLLEGHGQEAQCPAPVAVAVAVAPVLPLKALDKGPGRAHGVRRPVVLRGPRQVPHGRQRRPQQQPHQLERQRHQRHGRAPLRSRGSGGSLRRGRGPTGPDPQQRRLVAALGPGQGVVGYHAIIQRRLPCPRASSPARPHPPLRPGGDGPAADARDGA